MVGRRFPWRGLGLGRRRDEEECVGRRREHVVVVRRRQGWRADDASAGYHAPSWMGGVVLGLLVYVCGWVE